MKVFIFLSLLALISVCTAINCYSCTGCSDPFSSSASGVTTLTDQAECYKTTASGSATIRGGYNTTGTCISANAFGVGTFCCTTDLCNGAHANYQTSMILLGVSLAAFFAKLRWT